MPPAHGDLRECDRQRSAFAANDQFGEQNAKSGRLAVIPDLFLPQ
jgi:hypothetical protein